MFAAAAVQQRTVTRHFTKRRQSSAWSSWNIMRSNTLMCRFCSSLAQQLPYQHKRNDDEKLYFSNWTTSSSTEPGFLRLYDSKECTPWLLPLRLHPNWHVPLFFSLHPPNSVCFFYVLSLFNFTQLSEFNSTRIPLIDKRKRDKSIVFLLASDDQQKAICTAEARKSRNTYPRSEQRIIGCFDIREEYHFDGEMMVKPNRSFSWCIIN